MKISHYKDRESHLLAIYSHAVAAADPAKCVSRHLELQGSELIFPNHTLQIEDDSRLMLLAFGKASVSMAQEATRILGQRLSRGLVVTPTTYRGTLDHPLEVQHGNHPLPSNESLSAGRKAQALLSGLKPQDIVLVLISGGGSAMLELPKPGLGLDDLQSITLSLLRSGAPIEHINIIRTALSQTKGGGLVRMATPAQVVGLILSDVVGNSLEAIASGPTVTGSLDPEMARQLLQQHQLWDTLPQSIRQPIETLPELLPESPSPMNFIIGSNRLLVEAAQDKARELGFEPYDVVHDLIGEAREAGEAIAQKLIECPPGSCLILGGETTVTVLGEGLGGRNQELALAAAIKLDGNDQAALLSAASDGVDGPTDAAGGWVDGGAIKEAEAHGMDTEQALDENDSHTLLNRLGRLIKTGPSGTNVNDLVIGLKYTSGSG